MSRPTFNTEPEKALQAYLRAHIKAKYGPVKTAAYALKVSTSTIHNTLNGQASPPAALLADAGIKYEVVVTRTIQWEVMK